MILNLGRKIIPFLTIRSLPIYFGSFKQILGKEKREGEKMGKSDYGLDYQMMIKIESEK